MPQLDPAGFVPQLFWLAVIFLVLFLLMRGLAVPRVGRAIEARRQRLDGDLGRAAAMRTEAEAVLAGYETALAAARGEAQTRLRETAEQMAAAAAERQRELAATLARQVAAAESRIAAGRDQALADVRGIAADVGRAMVEKLTGATPDAAKLAAAVDAALAGDAPAGRAS
ncbi:MAG TPA: F0F1 ATP synthase subunit B' [Stellaceae bacterium]|nr:F0F1 ATP synthase subunit B' [Stellaceae bacterium]